MSVTSLTLETLEGGESGDNWKPRGQKRAPDQTRKVSLGKKQPLLRVSSAPVPNTLWHKGKEAWMSIRELSIIHTETHIPTASLQSIHITNTGMMCHQLTVAPYKEIRMVRVGGEMKQSDPVTLIRDDALITLPSSSSHEWMALIFNTERLLTQFPAKPL